ncbi:rhodanese-like domain-containing protein [Vicingaceae bacterium]|nr:rhodanese-like domain-containing protein [Vicingaceae bacterium]
MKFLELEANAFKADIKHKKSAFILDVREEYEFEDVNIGGVNMPMGEVLAHIEELKEKGNIYLICKSGKRSRAVAYHLSKELDNCNVYSCIGGIDAYTAV